MLLLRPHHINCIFFYRGLGYNQKFIDGMNKILIFLSTNPDSKIKLFTKCDIVCSKCPNKQQNGICITEQKVETLDYNTLYAYNLKMNEEYIFNQIINSIYINFSENKFHEICKTCNWYKTGTCNENIIESQMLKWNL